MGNIRFRLVREYLEPCEGNGNQLQSSQKMERATDDNARMRHIKDIYLYKGQY